MGAGKAVGETSHSGTKRQKKKAVGGGAERLNAVGRSRKKKSEEIKDRNETAWCKAGGGVY